MYRKHKIFQVTKTTSIPYWRYMSFWKFWDLIKRSALYFSNVSELSDQNEGKVPESIFAKMDKEFGKVHREAMNSSRDKIFVSCWTASEIENYAMWAIYTSGDKFGIAIKSNFERLKKAFKKCNESIHIGEINYYDKGKYIHYTDNDYRIFLNKLGYYKIEQEVRCLTYTPKSQYINVDLNELIEEVYITQFAYNIGFHDIIEYIREKYNLNFEIKISGLNEK